MQAKHYFSSSGPFGHLVYKNHIRKAQCCSAHIFCCKFLDVSTLVLSSVTQSLRHNQPVQSFQDFPNLPKPIRTFPKPICNYPNISKSFPTFPNVTKPFQIYQNIIQVNLNSSKDGTTECPATEKPKCGIFFKHPV